MENREQFKSTNTGSDASGDSPGQASQELWQRWRQGKGPTLQEVLAHAGEPPANGWRRTSRLVPEREANRRPIRNPLDARCSLLLPAVTRPGCAPGSKRHRHPENN
jgi:hypothetical protein